ncbi:MAG: hypothetical protein M1561_07055 [Gammaproteobacteria bacterium]|nr:hypothetical protein [Gammaproteobacteria bacterium]
MIDEIIAKLRSEYKLSDPQCLLLRLSLSEEKFMQAVRDEARNGIRDGKSLPSKLLMQIPGSAGYISIITPTLAALLPTPPPSLHPQSAQPQYLEELKKFATQYPVEFKKYDEIKIQVVQLRYLSKTLLEKKREADFLNVKLVKCCRSLMDCPAFAYDYAFVSFEIMHWMVSIAREIKDISEAYWRRVFSEQKKTITEIKFEPKLDGVQYGTIMHISYHMADNPLAQQQITYYIKTQQSFNDKKAGPVDPKELFVYIVLKYIGYGPTPHFYYSPNIPEAVLIATQDLAHTKYPRNKRKQFVLFATPEYGGSDFKARDLKYTDTCEGVVCRDVLVQVFCLQDVMANLGNFGYVVVNDHLKWKLLDFEIPYPSHLSTAPYVNDKIVARFIREDKVFDDYDKGSLRKFIYDLERGRKCHSRGGRKMPLFTALDTAQADVIKYLGIHERALGLDLKQACADLALYVRAIKINYTTLRDGIAAQCAADEKVATAVTNQLIEFSFFNVDLSKNPTAKGAEETSEKLAKLVSSYL